MQFSPDWSPEFDGASFYTPVSTNAVDTFNSAMDTIAMLSDPEINRKPLSSQLKIPLQNLSKSEQLNMLEKASKDCLLVCSAIAPGSGEDLFETMISASQRKKDEIAASDDLVVLMTAYKHAKTKHLRRQILSIYAYRYPMRMLKKMHQPYGNPSLWEIKQARLHASLHGPGTIPKITAKHRVRVDMGKVTTL